MLSDASYGTYSTVQAAAAADGWMGCQSQQCADVPARCAPARAASDDDEDEDEAQQEEDGNGHQHGAHRSKQHGKATQQHRNGR